MIKITYYSVEANSDTTEGRGHNFTLANFKDKLDAQTFANDKNIYGRYGIMGCRTLTVKEHTLVIAESFQENVLIREESLKASALKKLTDEEKKALGL